ncbi:hypothetical protein [Bordetella flabilis]|uniref:ASCH domain-containing protein n=1 Tax=Bordetella flabilis TaxID=463014 RepID=A0A193GH68_9BORD|nr:hypothetical protein [Bordetella flabilis]ANN78933.1 hypothetical protein BAU07_19020 [Bordetella flabilis]
MRERPILFSAPMVRAILAGTKTQTRRVVKPAKDRDIGCALAPCELAGEINRGEYRNSWYGKIGDRLWVRETHLNSWRINPEDPTGPRVFSHVAAFAADGHELSPGEKWIPSIHMLRAASRITLEITGVRVERLQQITAADARAEGILARGCLSCSEPEPCGCSSPHSSSLDDFRSLWLDINGPRSWNANPWVWVVEFRRVEA